MLKYALTRVLQTIPTLFGASVLIFLLVHLTGDPVMLMVAPETPPARIEELREQLGFNKPLHVQYLDFLKGVVRGNIGNSFRFRAPALDLVWERLPATLELAGLSTLFAVLIGLPLGILSAARHRSPIDVVVRTIAFLGQGIPSFWLGLVLIILFSVQLGWLPSSGRGTPGQLIMPVTTLAVFMTGALLRMTRSGMLTILRSDFIRTARAKGLPQHKVLYKHAARNAMIPVITLIGIYLGNLLGGAVATETIFAWPGVGRLVVDAVHNRDFPIVQATLLVIVGMFIAVNLIVDLAYSRLDPRIKYQ